MGDGSMEGTSQYVRPSRQASNSPTPPRQGNSKKIGAKGKNGQLKLQKFVKGSLPADNGQRNPYPGQGKARGGQNPQKKGGYVDKRPLARGLRQTERFDPLAVEDGEIQLDYDFCVTDHNKREPSSLNHLLNFKFAPLHQAHHAWSDRRKGYSGKWKHFNKEQFLQATCQFVVRAGGDYAVNFVDPDLIVDWELIEQVRMRCREMPSCPICLYPPTAAQMTRCGHIYCWSCILHYLSLSEKTWRKCPICYEAVHQKDLKSVMAMTDSTYCTGQEITMTLMKRAKDSVLALPKIKWTGNSSIPPLTSDDVEMQFSKLLVASPQEILDHIMAKDKSELQNQLVEVEQNDESGEEPFIKLAIQQYEEREKKLLEICDTEPKMSATDTGSLPSLEDTTCPQGAVVDNTVDKESVPGVASSSEHCGIPRRFSISSDDSACSSLPSDNQFYYFYQAEDGQCIFLHPVNARCLIEEYGSLEHCPQTISGNIVEMDCHTQTEDLRRRFRYLRHLPLTCEFAICELELKPPHVSWETLNYFKEDLRKRRVRRQKKAKNEAKHENKCKSKMSAYAGIKPSTSDSASAKTPNLDSEQEFPQQVGSSLNVLIASSPPTHGPWSSGSLTGTDEESTPCGTSFAKALSSGNKPFVSQSVAQKSRRQFEGPSTRGEKCSDNEEEECEPAVPSFRSAFTDALAFADLNLNIETVSEESTRGKGKRNKRKGKEKKLLFSTDSAMKL